MLALDKIQGVIWLDGEFIDWKKCQLHIATHALHYGGAVFEGIRIYNAKAFKLNEHNQRLINSARLLGYQLPYDLHELNEAVKETVARQKLQSGYIRVLAWRGSEEQQIKGVHCVIHVAVIAWDPFSGLSKYNQEIGLKLEVARWRKPSILSAPVQSKAAGLYMMATVMQNEARDNGFDDAIVLDLDGYITEATTANFFVIKQNILYTPPADCFLDGLTRQTVLEIASELGIASRIQKLKVEDLAGASGAFLTGTTLEIAPISSITDVKSSITYNFQPDPMIARIRAQYFLKTL